MNKVTVKQLSALVRAKHRGNVLELVKLDRL